MKPRHTVLFFLLINLPCLAFGDPMQTISSFFNTANKDNIRIECEKFYTEDVVFEDPVHRIEGREKLIQYYLHMYENVKEIKFEFYAHASQQNLTFASWTMHLKAAGLNGGELVKVDGTSYFEFNEQGKVQKHRDFFDLGSMVYEHVPVIGRLVKYIKSRLQN